MTEPRGRVVVGVDGSKASLNALRFAHRQARLTGAEVHAVTTWNYPPTFDIPVAYGPNWQRDAESILDTAPAEALSPRDVASVVRHVGQGHPAAMLLEHAEGGEMLVVGSRGHGGFRRR